MFVSDDCELPVLTPGPYCPMNEPCSEKSSSSPSYSSKLSLSGLFGGEGSLDSGGMAEFGLIGSSMIGLFASDPFAFVGGSSSSL